MALLAGLRLIHSITVRGLLAVLVWIVAGALAPLIARAEPGENPPRYHLQVGQKIEYRETRQTEGQSDRKPRFEATFWVVAENPNRSWTLLFHQVVEQVETDDHGKETKNKVIDEYGYFDLFADGRVIRNSAWTLLEPEDFFPRLPDGSITTGAVWESRSQDGWSKTCFKAGPPAADSSTWPFEARKEYLWDAEGSTSCELSEVFDLESSLIRSVKGRSEQRGSGKDKFTIGRELIASERLPEENAREFGQEAAIYFRAVDEARPLLDAADRGSKHAAELLDRAEAVFARLDGKLQQSVFRTIFELDRASRKEERRLVIETAEKFAAHLDVPSAEWQTTDLEGNPHSLKDYRGKVVVLDFWFSDCGWCVQAMPQMNQLAADFKDQPVAILGMNSDEKVADAQRIIDAFKLSYPTLKSRLDKEGDRISARYSILGFPAFVLIDQQGVVRDIHCGYTNSIRNDLATRINELLAEGAPPAANGPVQR